VGSSNSHRLGVFDLDPVYFLACHQPWSRLQVVVALHGKYFYQGGFQNRRRRVMLLVHVMPHPTFAAVFLLWPGGLKGNWAAVRVVARKKARYYLPLRYQNLIVSIIKHASKASLVTVCTWLLAGTLDLLSPTP
jgi:hypothetical protein